MSVHDRMVMAWVTATVAVVVASSARSNGWEFIGDLGDLLTGIAALLAIAIACIQFESWQDRRGQERRAEVAGRALVACTILKDCLLRVNGAKPDDIFDPEDTSSGDIEFAEALQSRLRRSEMIGGFEEAWVQVQSFLSTEINEREINGAMNALWSLRIEMDGLLDTARCACGPYGSSTPTSDKAWDVLQSAGLRTRIEDTYAFARSKLRPLA